MREHKIVYTTLVRFGMSRTSITKPARKRKGKGARDEGGRCEVRISFCFGYTDDGINKSNITRLVHTDTIVPNGCEDIAHRIIEGCKSVIEDLLAKEEKGGAK